MERDALETERLLAPHGPDGGGYGASASGRAADRLRAVQDRCVRRRDGQRATEDGGRSRWCGLGRLARRVQPLCVDLCCPNASTTVAPASWDAVAGDSPNRIRQLTVLVDRAKTAFDPGSSDHVAKLVSLWDTAKPAAEKPNFPKERRSRGWAQLGFQGTDPATDLRGTGMLGLDCVHELFAKRPEIANDFANNDLLCATACINVVQMLLVHLRIDEASHHERQLVDPSSRSDKSKLPKRMVSRYRAVQLEAMQTFLNLLEGCATEASTISLFAGLVLVAMQLTMRAWYDLYQLRGEENKPNLLDFRVLLYSARVQLMHLLAAGPRSMRALQNNAKSLETVLVDESERIP